MAGAATAALPAAHSQAGFEEAKGEGRWQDKVAEELKECSPCILTTIQGVGHAAIPHSRPLVTLMNDAFGLFECTHIASRKVAEVKANPRVCLLIGKVQAMDTKGWFEIEATASVHTDAAARDACWLDWMAHYFSGKADPNWCAIKFTPTKITFTAFGGPRRHVIYAP